MPLAFGAILGGTTTLVGTPPNILAGEMLRERGLEPFGLFAFAPVGLVLLGVGTVFMVTVGRRLLPASEPAKPASPGGEDLARLYQVQDKLFTLRLPADSVLAGRRLGEARLGPTLGAKVVAIRRGGRRIRPRGETVLEGGDLLLVQGRARGFGDLLRLGDAEVRRAALADLPTRPGGVTGVRARLAASSALAGRSLGALGFRDRFGLTVLAIRRGGALLTEDLAGVVLEAGDSILALAGRERIAALETESDFVVEAAGMAAIDELRDRLALLAIADSSPLIGVDLAASRIGELVGLTVGGIVRGGELLPAVTAGEVIRAGDRLVLFGDPARVEALHDFGELEVEPVSGSELEAEDEVLVEVAVAPRSSVAGKTLRELDFRNRYGLLALSIWRQGGPIHGDLADIPLRLGDALLLQCRRRRAEALVADPDFVLLTGAIAPRRVRKAPVALGGLALMIVLVVSGWQPIHVAAFTAATLVVLGGAVKMPEAYRAIEWRAIFLVAAVLPVGVAMERTGAAGLLAAGVGAVAEPLGPYGVLAALVVLSSLLSQGLDGAPAVVLLTPVVLDAAATLGLSPYPLMMGVALAASAAFMTPFSHKANLLVMGAGGYRSLDYLRVGTPLTVVLLVLMVLLIPWFFPF
jgi:di/tricarboxylate transporter